MALGVVDEHLDRIEAHRLGVDEPHDELGRVEQLEERRFVRGPGERSGVALGEAEARERGHLAEELLGHRLVHPRLAQAALDEPVVELLHLLARPPGAHRPAEPVRIGRAEATDIDGDPHHLLLVEDDPEAVAQDRLEGRVQVRHGLQALLAPQVRMDGIALDRSRPDDRDLDHQVVEVLRPALGERLHLGPALDLEDPDRIGRLEHLEDLRDVLRQAVEVEAGGAVVFDELEGLVDGGQHAQAEQVELDELERLHVALVELDDDPSRHRRPLERRDVDERGRRHEHPARMDAQVAREAIDAGAELQPAFPVREVAGAAAAGLRTGLRLDAGDRRVAGPVPGFRGLSGLRSAAAHRLGGRCRRVPAFGPPEPIRPPARRLEHARLGVDPPPVDRARGAGGRWPSPGRQVSARSPWRPRGPRPRSLPPRRESDVAARPRRGSPACCPAPR